MIFRFCKELRWLEIILALLIFTPCGIIVYKNYPNFKCELISSEARFGLKEIYHAQILYQSQYGEFTKFSKLHDETKRIYLKKDYFDFYDAATPSQFSFKIIAKGRPGTLVSGEIWSIDEYSHLRNEVVVCQK